MQTLNIHEAKTHFSRLIQSVLAGEEVVIAKAGRPLVKMSAITQEKKPRRLGTLKGKVTVASDFDAPLPQALLDAFYGKKHLTFFWTHMS